jgi:signal transduction histidine kinase
MSSHYKHSIQFKLTAFISLLLIFTGGILIGVSYFYTHNLLVDRIDQQFSQAAETRQQSLMSYIELHQTLVVSTADRIHLIDQLAMWQENKISPQRFQVEVNRTLQILQKDHPNFQTIFIADPAGKVIASTAPELLNQDFASHPDFKAGQNSNHFGLPFRYQAGYQTYLSAPILSLSKPDTRLLGVVMIKLNIDPMVELLTQSTKLGKTSEVVLATPMGDHVHFIFPLRHQPDKSDYAFSQVLPMANAIRGKSGTIVSRDYRGVDVLAAFRPVGYRDWGLVAKIDLSEVYEPVMQLRNILLAIGMSILLLGIWVTFLFVKRFSQPIKALNEAALTFAKGDFDTRVTPQSQDEIGSLGISFNHMAEELQDSYATLEHKVAERTAQLETVNKELEAFSYSVSHDLRAPLRSIDGFSKILLTNAQDKLTEEEQRYLGNVCKNTQRMGELIDDLLKLSRLTRAEMRHENVDLSAMAKEILDTCQEREPDRPVQIKIADGVVVNGDINLLRVLMENLLNNAWKFTGKKEDASIEFGAQKNETGESVYYVRDNGAGFNMKYVHKLFGAFQRLHRMEEFSGTGIGLATVQRVMHRHSGRVWAEGEPDKGATFYFSF